MNYKDKKKILIGVNNFCVAGAQKLVLDYLNNFDNKKYELALITFFQSKEDNFFNLLPEYVKNYKLDFNNFYDFKNWIRVYKILREYNPDIILSHLFFSNTVLRIFKLFFNYKIIIYEHNVYINKTKLKVLVDRILSNFTYKIIADSNTVKKFTILQEKINPQKFEVIPCAINYQEIQDKIGKYCKEDLKKQLGFSAEDNLIINAARLVWQKNHQLLIDSFFEFNKVNNKYKLIILGDGPLYSHLNNHIKKLNLENKVLLLGQKRNVLEYMFISDFLVMASKVEGFPIVCLEALAVGLPIVSTKVAGLDESIVNEYNGFLSEENNSKSIALAMQKIANYESNYFNKNCQITAQKYDIKNTIDRLTRTMF